MEDIAGRIAEADERLRLYSYELGLKAAACSSVLPIHVGRKLLEAAAGRSRECDEAEKKLAALRSFLSSYAASQADLEDTERRIGQADDEIRMLSIRLGAMIYEECSLSLLDKEAFRIVYDDVREDERLRREEGNVLSRFLLRGQLKVRQRGEESRFLSYADLVKTGGLGSQLGSGKAEEALRCIQALEDERQSLSCDKSRLEAILSEGRERYREAVRGGEETLSGEAAARKAAEESALTEYGSYLYSRGSEWVDKDTPQELLDILSAMLEVHGQRDELVRSRSRIERDSKVEDCRAMIESEEGKIAVLEREKARIDREIQAIREEIGALEEKIRRLGDGKV